MNEKAGQSLFSCYSVISGTVTLKLFSMNSYCCSDYNIVMDTGYQSGAHMNIAINQVSQASL